MVWASLYKHPFDFAVFLKVVRVGERSAPPYNQVV